MKLNPDCIRDVMLTLENELSICIQEYDAGDIFRFDSMRVERLILIMSSEYEYANTDTVYSVLQLMESGYIVTSGQLPIHGKHNMVTIGDILYITPKGHEFVASMYDANNWAKKIKPILVKVGSLSLSIIESVSKGITDAAIGRLLAVQDNA